MEFLNLITNEFQSFVSSYPYTSILLAVHTILLVVIVASGAILLRRIIGSEGEATRIRSEAEHEARAIINRAMAESARLTSDASKEIAGMIVKTQMIVAGAKQTVERSLETLLEKESSRIAESADLVINLHRRFSEESKHSHQKISEGVEHILQDGARESLAKFEKFLDQETKRFRELTDERASEIHEHTLREITAYKQNAFKGIDDAVRRMVGVVSKEMLGRALTLEDHEALLERALKEAKKEGFFLAKGESAFGGESNV